MIREDIDALNNTVKQLDFTDIYRTFHSPVAEYAFFSSAHGISTNIAPPSSNI